MPRKKQKGPPPRANRPGGPKPQGQGASPAQSKGKKQNPAPSKGAEGQGPKKLQPLQTNQRPIVPFLRGDRILLIGEGDFSFARSLAKQYKCRKVCATCYDSKETLYGKYPQAEGHIQEILESGSKAKAKAQTTAEAPAPAEGEEEDTHQEKESAQNQPSASTSSSSNSAPKVLFSIDARKLGAQGGGGKEIQKGFRRRERKLPAWKLHQKQQEEEEAARKAAAAAAAAKGNKRKFRNKEGREEKANATPAVSGPWDVICFNFPHVGGISTDVNRQVRANQELLVSFFEKCVPLLSKAPEPVGSDEEEELEWESGSGSESESGFSSESGDDHDGEGEGEGEGPSGPGDVSITGKATRTGPGQILVSLFEAEPYTLWNIRDLARHAGLQVVTSFKFPWASYEGYSHARTLGEVEGKDGGRGGWRGEDREARMYVFEVKKEVKQGKKNKRSRDDDSDSE